MSIKHSVFFETPLSNFSTIKVHKLQNCIILDAHYTNDLPNFGTTKPTVPVMLRHTLQHTSSNVGTLDLDDKLIQGVPLTV